MDKNEPSESTSSKKTMKEDPLEVHGSPNPIKPDRTAFIAKVALKMIAGYQFVRAGRPSPCRYSPSCSEYAYEAVERHGFFIGFWLSIKRVARCNPFGGSGYDPVPDVSQKSASSKDIK